MSCKRSPRRRPTPVVAKKKPKIGKDNDYPGGTDRRKWDKKAQEILPGGRWNKLVMAGHMVEHTGRAAYAAIHNRDFETMWGELGRAAQNFPGFIQLGPVGLIDLLFIPGQQRMNY